MGLDYYHKQNPHPSAEDRLSDVRVRSGRVDGPSLVQKVFDGDVRVENDYGLVACDERVYRAILLRPCQELLMSPLARYLVQVSDHRERRRPWRVVLGPLTYAAQLPYECDEEEAKSEKKLVHLHAVVILELEKIGVCYASRCSARGSVLIYIRYTLITTARSIDKIHQYDHAMPHRQIHTLIYLPPNIYP